MPCYGQIDRQTDIDEFPFLDPSLTVQEIASDFGHRVVHVSECYLGTIHDITMLRESGLLEHVNDSVQIVSDKGYIGEEYVVIGNPRKNLTDVN